MNSTKNSILANFAGRIFTAVLGIVFVPVYLKYLSVEIYGIIGFFTGLQAILQIFDVGISPTLNREIARLSPFPEKSQELRNLSRTLEFFCWGTAIVVGVAAFLVSPLIAHYWLQSENIPAETIDQSLKLMSVSFVFQWATAFYTGGLLGFQKQVLSNTIIVFVSIFRSVGAFLVLAFISQTVQAFLYYQAISALLNVLLVGIFFWRTMPPATSKTKFEFALLKNVWRYAAGITGLGLVTLMLTQVDKIVLSKILTLEQFGYYTLAGNLANMSVGIITGSIVSVYFPQFSQIVALHDETALRRLYHRSCQVMSVFLLPAVFVIAALSWEILFFWTRNADIAQNSYLVLSLVVIGSGLNGLLHLYHHIQLAYGITKIAFWQNVVGILFLTPLIIFVSFRYGAVGGASAWIFLNILYLFVGAQIGNRYVMRGELTEWYIHDIGIPILVCAAVLLVRVLMNLQFSSNIGIMLDLIVTSSVTFAACALATRTTRNFILQYLPLRFKSKLISQ